MVAWNFWIPSSWVVISFEIIDLYFSVLLAETKTGTQDNYKIYAQLST